MPYWSIDAFYALSLFVCASKAELDTHALRLLTAQIGAVACFILFPLRFTFVRPETTGLDGLLFAALTSFDKPFNQAPSLHIALLCIIWVLFARHVPRWVLWPMRLWFAVLAVSVLTTYQHHFIDVPTGALLGFLCLWLWPDRRPSPLAQISLARERRRLVLAARYAVAAAALAIAGIALGGAALWLLWPAVSLALVAANYAVFGAGGFQKGPDGRMSLAALALFLPYLIGAWINSRLWTRHDDEAAAVGDDVFIGRNPWPRAAREFAAIVDLCAELPGSAGSQTIPLLDLVAPTPELLARGRDDDRAGASGGSCAGMLRPRLWAQRGRGSCLADSDGARNKRRGGGRSDSPRPTSGRPRSRRAGGGGAGGTPCMIGGADAVERDLAAAAAALLDQGQRADHLSRLITAASAIVLLLLPAVSGATAGAADDNPRAGRASRSRGALFCDPCRLRCRAVPSLGGCA